MHGGGLGLLISKAEVGTYVAIANDSSNMFPDPESKLTSSKSNCTVLNKWHVKVGSFTWNSFLFSGRVFTLFTCVKERR